MIKTILAFFGYVKIPTAAVQLSTMQEYYLSKCVKHESDPRGKALFNTLLNTQKTLTGFLRSGKLISG